jgi:plastocyanin
MAFSRCSSLKRMGSATPLAARAFARAASRKNYYFCRNVLTLSPQLSQHHVGLRPHPGAHPTRFSFSKMKTLALTFILLAAVVSPMWAADHIVAVSDTEFTPRVVNAQAGDTITWVLVAGSRGHNVASVTIPPAAEPWSAPVDAEHPEFRVVVPVPGEYRYHCSIHLFMKGTIRVRPSGQ